MSSTCGNMAVAIFSVIALLGCGEPASEPATTVEPGVEVKPPAELLSELIAFDAEIRKASEEDSLEDAHGALHDIGTTIEQLRSGVEAGSMGDEARQQALDSLDQLMTLFGDVDATLHGKEGKLYSDVAKDVKQEIERLQSISLE
jgi:hypothetical protein